MAPSFIVSENELDQLLREKFTSEFRTGYITIDGVCLPEYFRKFADRIENFEVRDDDIWVCSFPKTGTTWTQEMVWCLANDLDFEKGKTILSERFPFLELTPLFDYTRVIPKTPGMNNLPEVILDSVSFVDKMSSRRFIKTHLPFHLLPRQIRTGEKRPKIIYVNRNVKDTCVSYYHHCHLFEGYSGTFEEFCALFLGGKVCFGPFWNHVLGFFEKRKEADILFLKYETMKTDLKSVINETAKFLEKETLTGNKMEVLEKHLSFANMKSNPAVNYDEAVEFNIKFKLIEKEGKFMRSGKINQWQESMSKEMIDRFDSWTKECLKDKKLVCSSYRY